MCHFADKVVRCLVTASLLLSLLPAVPASAAPLASPGYQTEAPTVTPEPVAPETPPPGEEPPAADTPVPTDTATTPPETPASLPAETATLPSEETAVPVETATASPPPAETATVPPVDTPVLEETVLPTETASPPPAETAPPPDTTTPLPTETAGPPTETPTSIPTETPVLEATATPTVTLSLTPTATLVPTPAPGQLSLVMTVEPVAVTPGGLVTVSLTLSNPGRLDMTGLVINVSLPAGFSYYSPLGPISPGYNPLLQLLAWSLPPELASVESLTVGCLILVTETVPPQPVTLTAEALLQPAGSPAIATAGTGLVVASRPAPANLTRSAPPPAGPPARIQLGLAPAGRSQNRNEQQGWLAVLVLDAGGRAVADGTEVRFSVQDGQVVESVLQTRHGQARTRLTHPAGQTIRVTAAAGQAQAELVLDPAAGGELAAALRRTGNGYGPETEAMLTARNRLAADGQNLVAENRSRRVEFNRDGLEFTLKDRAEPGRDLRLGFRLADVRVGQVSLLDQQPAPQVDGRWAVYRPADAGWQMAYEAGDGSVEQYFVFEHGLPEGDLVIEGEFRTPLEPRFLSDQEGIVFSPRGAGRAADEAALGYGPARVEDARGEQILARMALDGRRLRLTIPGDWLAKAEFPVVVDPLIGPAEQVSQLQGHARNPALASDGTDFLVVWDWNGDIYGQVIDSSGDRSGDLFAINQAEDDQMLPEVVYNPVSGEYLVIWTDQRFGYPYRGLYARRLSTGGALLGSELMLVPPADRLGRYNGPEAAVTTTGHVLVVWPDYSSGSYDVFGQLLDSSGSPTGGIIPVSGNTAGTQWKPDLAYDSQTDTFLAVWADNRDGNGYDLYGQRLTGSGVLTGTHLVVADTTNQDVYEVAVAGNGSDQFLAGWQQVMASDNYDVFAQRVTAATGSLAGSRISLDTGSGKDADPAVLAISASEYLVMWEDNGYMLKSQRVRSSDGSLVETTPLNPDEGYEPALARSNSQLFAAWEEDTTAGQALIIGQRLAFDNTTSGGLIYVSPYYSTRTNAAVAYQPQPGEYLLAWEQAADSPYQDIFTQRLDRQGQPVGDTVNVTADPAAGQEQPAVAGGNGSYLLVWQDRRNIATTDIDIYGQLLDATGHLSGSLIVISNAADSQHAPVVAYNSQRNEYLVAWHDYRDSGVSGADIYAQIVGVDGSLKLGTPLSIVAGNDQRYPSLAYNAGADNYLLAWEDGRPGTVSVDIYGQLVNGDGSLAGASFVVASASNYQYRPAVAYSPAGEVFLTAWYDRRDGVQWDIYGQVISGTAASLVGSNFAISSASSDQEYPAVAARYGDPSDEFVVAWQDRRNDSDRDIYLQRVDAAGNLLDEPDTPAVETSPTVNLPLAVSSADNYQQPALVYNPDDHLYLLAWNNQDDGGVYVQRYSPAVPAAPAAGFTVSPSSGVVPLAVTFSDTSTGQIGDREWDFGDGSPVLSTRDITVTHTFIATGAFSVTLTVSNPGGSSLTSTVVAVSAQTTPVLDEDFESYAVGSDPLYWLDQAGDGTGRDDFKVWWRLGEGQALGSNTETDAVYSHYAIPGWPAWQNYEFRGRLQVADEAGESGLSLYSGYLAGQARAYLLRRTVGGEPNSFYLAAAGGSLVGDTLVELDSQAGAWYRFRLQATSHSGRTNVRAKVWPEGQSEPAGWQAVADDESAGRLTAGAVGVVTSGPWGKYLDDLVVEPLLLQAGFSAAGRVAPAPYTATFVAGPVGQVLTYTWDFGDGTAGQVTSVPTATHTYLAAGSYDVTLTVEGPAGSDTLTRPGYIETYVLGSRARDGLRALYTFDEGSGTVVHDVSGVGEPLDLTIINGTAVSWLPGGLAINAATRLDSGLAATKIISAAKASHELSLEAWLKPANTTQTGPARILSLSPGVSQRNFTLGQAGDRYDVRLRTTATNDNGSDPSLSSPAGSLATDLTHLVYTRDAAGAARIYLDGQEVAGTAIGGDLSTWAESYPLLLANELTGNRPWLGELHLVAVYSRALGPAEVHRNYQAGADGAAGVTANFSAAPPAGPAPLAVQFVDSSSGAAAYLWDFGDGITSTQASPGHTYTQPGVYTVTLTVDDGDLLDVLARPAYIHAYSSISLTHAFAFGADTWTRATANAPGVNYVKVVQNGQNFTYSAGQGHGYVDTADIDTTPNNRGVYSGADEIYDQFIGARNGGVIVFRLDLPDGRYRFVAAGGDAQYSDHATTIQVQDGTSDRLLTLVQDYQPTAAGQFWTVELDEKVVPPADGLGANPTFVPQADSGTLEVSQGYIRLMQRVGTGRVAGGDLSLLEVWRIDEAAPAPLANFSAFPTSGTLPLTVQFFDNSTGAESYLWDFGDTLTSTQSSPSHTYTLPGVYTVTLTVAGSGPSDTLTRPGYITVTAPITADFSAEPLAGPAPLAVTFSNSSTNATDYQWDYGDGITSTITAPTHVHTYTQAGVYTVTLTASNAITSHTQTRPAYITAVLPATFPTTGILDDFNRANGTIGGNWSGMTTGFSLVSNQLDVNSGQNYIYWNPASFGADQEAYVSLAQIDQSGTSVNLLLKFRPDGSGVIQVGYNPAGQRVQVWTYTAAQDWVQRGADIPVTLANGDQLGARAMADGQVEVYRNGVLLASRDVTAWPYYADAGYIGLLSINSAAAVLDDFGGGTVVESQAPVAAFSAEPVAGVAPLAVTFTNNSTHATEYVWAYGDGITSTTTAPTHVYTYTQAGVYTVTLWAGNGAITVPLTRPGYITVTDTAIEGLAAVNDSPTLLGETTTFTVTISAGSNVSYDWAFGDGQSGSGAVVTHTYSQTGAYTAVVTASNPASVVTATTAVTITGAAGLAISKTAPASVVAGEPVTYTLTITNSGPGPAANLLITDTLPISAHYVSGGGLAGDVISWTVPSLAGGEAISVTFTVTAATTITNSDYAVTVDGGISAVGQQAVTTEIYPPIVPDFSAEPLSGTVPLTVTFVNSTTGASTYLWAYGDGITSTITATNHVYTYTQAGVYTVTLWAGNGAITVPLTRPAYITVTTAITRDWQVITTATTLPPVVGEHGLAYDSSRGVFVLYGGNTTGWPYEDLTWELDDAYTDWISKPTTTRPAARYGAGLAYDSARDVTVLFGGSDETDTALAQTWEYSGTDWIEAPQVTSPPARTYPGIATNPISGTIYLFGGNDGEQAYDDLWKYDNGEWIDLGPGGTVPQARTLAAMTYVSSLPPGGTEGEYLLLFGGRSVTGTILSDFWAYNFSTSAWSQIDPGGGPPGRMAHSLTYDPATSNAVLVGGIALDGETVLTDTWHYNGGWSEVNPSASPPRPAYHQAVYHDNAIILVSDGEVWKYE